MHYARESQLPPTGPWRIWLVLTGRGWGKSRLGAEWVRTQVKDYPLVNLIGATADDARDIMIEGPSGILSVCPPHERPEYKSTKRQLLWPNGAKSLIFTADQPERLRGKQHQKLWCDELGAWRYPEAWHQALFGLRLGDDPQALVTTTPKPTAVVKEIIEREDVQITHGTTYENRENLAPQFFADIIRKYEGTRLGRQELLAELLTDNPHALWKREWLDRWRVTRHPPLNRIVVGVDPSGGVAECGIVVAGRAMVHGEWHVYVLDDRSLAGRAAEWGQAVVTAYHMHQADRVLGERNYGGDMVYHTIRTVEGGADVAYRDVTATRGKEIRAEPVSALYEQGRVHHVGTFAQLEDELCTWSAADPLPSPNRLDALVWAVTALVVDVEELKIAGARAGG